MLITDFSDSTYDPVNYLAGSFLYEENLDESTLLGFVDLFSEYDMIKLDYCEHTEKTQKEARKRFLSGNYSLNGISDELRITLKSLKNELVRTDRKKKKVAKTSIPPKIKKIAKKAVALKIKKDHTHNLEDQITIQVDNLEQDTELDKNERKASQLAIFRMRRSVIEHKKEMKIMSNELSESKENLSTTELAKLSKFTENQLKMMNKLSGALNANQDHLDNVLEEAMEMEYQPHEKIKIIEIHSKVLKQNTDILINTSEAFAPKEVETKSEMDELMIEIREGNKLLD